MIPPNITKKHILQAVQEIESKGLIPPNRESVNYDLFYNNKRYPPKYVISIANKFANEHELKSTEFDAIDAKTFLSKLGFEIKLKFDIKPGDIINNQQISTLFSVGTQGEMRKSNKTNTLVLISDQTKDFYKDEWKGDIFHYTGMGLTGDQDKNYSQNKTLTNSKSNGVEVHLFEVFSSGQYTYQGIFELADKPYEQIQKGQSGNNRKVVIFPLKLVAEMANNINEFEIDYYSAIIDSSKISQLILESGLHNQTLSRSEESEKNQEIYHSNIVPAIDEFKEKYGKLTPNQVIKKILYEYARKYNLLDNFDCQSFHFVGQKVKSYVWGAITKKDPNIKNLKVSYYPQLYITITPFEIRFGLGYGDQVKDSDISVDKIRKDSQIINKIIQINKDFPEVKIYLNDGEMKLSSENFLSPLNNLTILNNWKNSSILVDIYVINELPIDIIDRIELVFNSLLEIFLKISGDQGEKFDKINPVPIKHTFKKQVILYGPPGTGKTYGSVIRAHEIIFGYQDPNITFSLLLKKLKEQSKKEIDFSQLSWLEAIVLAFHEIGKNIAQVGEIKNTETIKKFSAYKNSHAISNTIWYILQAESKIDSKTVNTKNKSGKEYFDKNSESNWYLTEKGLEYQKRLIEDLTTYPETSTSQFIFITFHQSFAYEDFIEGIRPELNESGDSTITYQIKDGIFKEICKKAALDPNNNYVLIIDEINRGNISKIFGELITLLEDNKRAGEVEEITVKLPYSGQEFSVPTNVYIIGTMNSTDKSIALVDIALRRRFHFERLHVEYELIKNEDAKKFLQEINNIICAIKNPDYEIGHYYFMNIPEIDRENRELENVFSTRILPLLEEYFFNDWEALATIFGRDSIKVDKKKKFVLDEDSGKFEGDSDHIYGLSIKETDIVFKNTLKNLGIYLKNLEAS